MESLSINNKKSYMTYIKRFFTKGHERSTKLKKNIIVSFLLRAINIATNIALVPMMLNYLSPEKYGIWLTLSAIISWVVILDVGLGNGLRNKFTECIANSDHKLARIYVSTTYACLLVIMGLIYILFVLLYPFLNWVKILNMTPELTIELKSVVFITFTFFVLRIVFQLIGTILVADQKPAIRNSFETIGSLLSIAIIYFLTKTTSGSLLYIAATLSGVPVFVLIIASFVFFKKSYKKYRPSIKYIKLKYFKRLFHLGFQFFIIQISTIILFSTDNIIIAQLYSPSEVVPYNIAFKYFSVTMIVFTIICAPFWSSFTDAYIRKDFVWIKKSIKKLVCIWGGVTAFILIMLIASGPVYRIWVGNVVNVPSILSMGMALFVIIKCWTSIFTYFINGVGRIRLQLYSSVFVAIINIPLSIIFAKYCNLGPPGVIFATCACLILGSAILHPIQYSKIVNTRAKGVWAK